MSNYKMFKNKLYKHIKQKIKFWEDSGYVPLQCKTDKPSAPKVFGYPAFVVLEIAREFVTDEYGWTGSLSSFVNLIGVD